MIALLQPLLGWWPSTVLAVISGIVTVVLVIAASVAKP